MVEPTKNKPGHELKDADTNQPKWDSFFNGGPRVSPDFMAERSSQDVTNRPAVGAPTSWTTSVPVIGS